MKFSETIFDVTLVSQSSQDDLQSYLHRLDRFALFAQEIVNRWNGYAVGEDVKSRMISIAIRIDDSSKPTLQSLLKTYPFPQRLHLSYLVDNSNHYPINRLRNLAINNTVTSHFFLTDIDVWPACRCSHVCSCLADLYSTILNLPTELLSIQKQAIVVPAFEVSYNSKQLRIVEHAKGVNRGKDAVCTDLETCWFKYMCFLSANQTSVHGSSSQARVVVVLEIRSLPSVQAPAIDPCTLRCGLISSHRQTMRDGSQSRPRRSSCSTWSALRTRDTSPTLW